MSNFVPNTNDYFYVQTRPIKHEPLPGWGLQGVEEKTVVVQDRSYIDQIYLCVGRDDYAVVGKPVFGSYNKATKLFAQHDVIFRPVGPEVVSALELSRESTP